MKLFVIIDTKGAGRVLGVFNSVGIAQKLVAQDPNYYQLHPCHLNQINEEALHWVGDPHKRQQLAALATASESES